MKVYELQKQAASYYSHLPCDRVTINFINILKNPEYNQIQTRNGTL
jgi:hypothetical protein